MILLDSTRIEQNRRFALFEASPEAFSRSDYRIANFDYLLHARSG